MNTLLYIDLLGVRDRWRFGGRTAAESLFARFRRIAFEAARSCDTPRALKGGVESDSLALNCPTSRTALRIASQMFRTAFLAPRRPDDERLWMRGVLEPCSENISLRSSNDVAGLDGIEEFSYDAALLDAIAVERSGFKGMRLLLHGELVTDALRGEFRLPVGAANLIPFRKLNNSQYPERISSTHQDFLWMAESSEEISSALSVKMMQRLRWSAGKPEEFVHAAATQVLFHEYSTIRSSLEHRALR